MKGFIVLALLATAGYASASTDFQGQWMPQGSNECFHKAWDAAQPSDAQKENAKDIMMKVHDVHHRHEAEIKKAAQQFHSVMSHHPISQRLAFKAGRDFQAATAPVQRAMFGGGIAIINLLDLNQRAAFNTALHECLKDGHQELE